MVRSIAALAVFISLASSLFGQAPSEPDRLIAVAAQAAEAELRLALRKAERLTRTDSRQARADLRQMQDRLETDRMLPDARRKQWQRLIADRLRVLDAPTPAIETPVDPPINRDAQRKSAELARLVQELKSASELRKSGQGDPAAARLAEITQRFAETLAVKTDAAVQQASARISDSSQTRGDKERSIVKELGDVDRAAIIPNRDVTFPNDFKERTARRRSDTAPTAEELRILKALESPVQPRYENSPLETAMDHLSTLINLPIVLDKGALDELRIAPDTPVTFAVKKPIMARAALRAILRNVGLTYVISDGVVFATTPDRARAYLVTKVYSVADLVVPIDLFDPFGEMLNVATLIDTIIHTVDPDSWEHRGGPGVIRYYSPTRSIIVRQSAEIQTMVKRSLIR